MSARRPKRKDTTRTVCLELSVGLAVLLPLLPRVYNDASIIIIRILNARASHGTILFPAWMCVCAIIFAKIYPKITARINCKSCDGYAFILFQSSQQCVAARLHLRNEQWPAARAAPLTQRFSRVGNVYSEKNDTALLHACGAAYRHRYKACI